MTTSSRDRYGLPPRLFLYTVDQIMDMLQVSDPKTILFYDGRSIGVAPSDRMLARNVAPSDEKPEWRVSEDEFIRWMRATGTITMARPRRSR
jgi:hypothetical protein